MLIEPDKQILQRFGVELVAELGGRLNLHWLVERKTERLVLRRWSAEVDDIGYELRLLERLAALGWPVAPALTEPVEYAGYTWSLAPFLPGEPFSTSDPLAEQRMRGRLLAQLHADLAQLHEFGQRGKWRRCETILADPTLDPLLENHKQHQPELVHLLRWHLQRARKRTAGLQLSTRPGIIIHGDFTQWNLRFIDGRLTGILDFELAHWDHRVGDFALAWRGKYDQVLHGYNEVSPLKPEEWELLTPLWWAFLVEGACQHLRDGTEDDGWIARMLLRRSPLMGPDAEEFS